MSVAPAVVRNQLTTSGGLTLGYREWGRADGPVAILLHGLGSDAEDWALVGPGLGRFRVIALDARGHGQSDWSASYELSDLRDDVLEAMDALGVLAAAVIGHSMGGVVAYLLAATHPARVRALVLEDMPAPVPADPPREIPVGPDPGETCDWRAVAALRTWRNDPDPSWWDFAPDIRARTLVVGGGQSSLPQDRLADLTRLIPRGRFVSLDTTHTVHGERPGEFLAIVGPFLDDAIR
ncbi:MAG TPA: alpha/beta fold hydrolase [Microlunatus sp.]